MIYLKIKDLADKILLNSFPPDFNLNNFKEKRFFSSSTDTGIVEGVIIDEPRISRSNKVFSSFTSLLVSIINSSMLKNIEKAKGISDDYLHNIIKIHGDQKSIIERCIASSEGQENYADFVEEVRKNIQRNPQIFAQDICALSREIRLVDHQIGGYNLIHDLSSRISITDNHNLKKFILGLLHIFYDTFNKSGVKISMYDVDENFTCSFEYETFNIAMQNFIENALKYAMPDSKIVVKTTTKGELVFTMDSIRIDKDEVERIFERGVYGRCVPQDLKGQGIGMYQLKKALDRSGVFINIIPDLSESSELAGIRYTKNTFVFKFPKYSFSPHSQ